MGMTNTECYCHVENILNIFKVTLITTRKQFLLWNVIILLGRWKTCKQLNVYCTVAIPATEEDRNLQETCLLKLHLVWRSETITSIHLPQRKENTSDSTKIWIPKTRKETQNKEQGANSFGALKPFMTVGSAWEFFKGP